MTGKPKEIHMYQPGPDIDDDATDLGDLLGALIENRWLIVVITLASLAVGAYKAYTTVPIYRADGLMQIEEKSAGGLAGLEAAWAFEQYVPAIAEIEILRSRKVLGAVVDELKLDINAAPEYMPYIGEALARRRPADERPVIEVDSLELPESLRGRSLKLLAGGGGSYTIYDSDDGVLLRGRVGETAIADVGDGEQLEILVSKIQGDPDQVFWVSRSSKVSAVRSLQGRLGVSERSQWSGMLEISVVGPNPGRAKEEVDAIANAYVAQNVARKAEEASKTLDFLEEQLPDVRNRLEEAERKLNEFRAQKGSIDLTLETQTVLNTIVTVEARINELRREREKTTLAFTNLHPMVVALDRQIEQLGRELESLNAQVQSLPETQQELLGLIRDVEVNTALYTSLLSTTQELRVVEAGTVGNVRVIDYAVRPTSPIRPNKSRIMSVAMLLGALIGIAVALARKVLSSGVDDPDLIEKQVNIPVYATIAHSKRQDKIYKALKSKERKRAILAVDKPDDPAIESIRNLRTALHFGMMNVENSCVMIAGPSPGVGKSFVSVNLAAVLATNEKKVLLIDADLRRGHLHEYLGIERSNGLSEFISGDIPIGQVLHQTTVPGLTLIPTGVLPPNPAELLLHQRFANCLRVLAPRYDHIIVDSPPILAVTDASIIGQIAGGTLIVLKAGEHPMREIELAVRRLQQANVNLRGILFNDVRLSSRRYGAGRYTYYYNYGQGGARDS